MTETTADPEVPSDPPRSLVPQAPPDRLTRRRLLGLTAAGALGGVAWKLAVVPRPPRLADLGLSDAAKALVAEAWRGLDPARVVDVHCHLVGLGAGGTGCTVNPESLSVFAPTRWIKTRFYKGASGIYDDAIADRLFVERLVDLSEHRTPRVRTVLLAFDRHHDREGRPVEARTEFHVPDAYAAQVAGARPDLFAWGCSVHPHRADALDALARAKDQGAVLCKWLPNAMGIDPADPRCDAFYERLVALGLPLLTHTGEEQAVHAEEEQELGNPLRLRRPLAAGVTVVAAHCASLGRSDDLDEPAGADGRRPDVTSYALFLRLLGETHRGRLWGDLSATTQFNRCAQVLPDLLRRPDVQARLVHGSDYPLPAIDPVIRTRQLVGLGLIDPAERPVLNELFAYNPLTFDLVVKRRLRVVEGGVVHRLADACFESARLWGGA